MVRFEATCLRPMEAAPDPRHNRAVSNGPKRRTRRAWGLFAHQLATAASNAEYGPPIEIDGVVREFPLHLRRESR